MTGKRPKDENRQAGPIDTAEILPEYDFSRARPNKYAARFAGDSIAVVLDPDVAEMFPSAGEVNEALRALGGIIRKHRPGKRPSRGGG
jgi:hypothetical protein